MFFFFLAYGCGVDWGFGGQDMGDYATAEVREPDEAPEAGDTAGSMSDGVGSPAIVDLVSSCEAESDAAEALALTGGTGRIDVVHSAFRGNCCAQWVPLAEIGETWIAVRYSDIASGVACDCECPWTLSYAIEGVPAGEWRVYAGSVFGDATVD